MRATNAIEVADYSAEVELLAPRITKTIAPRLKAFDVQSKQLTAFPIKKNVSATVIIGLREQTIPTVETLKYLTLINAMYTQIALWQARNIRGLIVVLSMQS